MLASPLAPCRQLPRANAATFRTSQSHAALPALPGRRNDSNLNQRGLGLRICLTMGRDHWQRFVVGLPLFDEAGIASLDLIPRRPRHQQFEVPSHLEVAADPGSLVCPRPAACSARLKVVVAGKARGPGARPGPISRSARRVRRRHEPLVQASTQPAGRPRHTGACADRDGPCLPAGRGP